MERIPEILRDARKSMGWTQVQLAARAGVSLPTIQNIEAGKGNPSWDVLEKLFEALGLEWGIKAKMADWSKLAQWGVGVLGREGQVSTVLPTLSKRKPVRFDFDSFCENILRACVEVRSSADIRKREALTAFLHALSSHYPGFFKKLLGRSGVFRELLDHLAMTGRIIKLRRYSLAVISTYL